VFFPLGPTIGILGFPYREKLHRRLFRSLDFSERFTLNCGYTALLNLRLWEEADRLALARLDDEMLLRSIDSGEKISLDPCGSYRFRRFFSLGMSDELRVRVDVSNLSAYAKISGCAELDHFIGKRYAPRIS